MFLPFAWALWLVSFVALCACFVNWCLCGALRLFLELGFWRTGKFLIIYKIILSPSNFHLNFCMIFFFFVNTKLNYFRFHTFSNKTKKFISIKITYLKFWQFLFLCKLSKAPMSPFLAIIDYFEPDIEFFRTQWSSYIPVSIKWACVPFRVPVSEFF